MSRRARAFLLWALAMLAGAAIVWNSRFTADMSFFLPSTPSAEQQVLIDQLKEGVVSRLLMVGIEGGDGAQRAAASRALRERLAARPDFVSVQNGEAGSIAAERDLLFARRYLLSPAVGPQRFTVDGLRDAISGSIDLLASPAGMLVKPFLTRDPTGELYELVSNLNGGSQPAMRDGVWASRDGSRALLLLQTRALGSDTDGQEAAIAAIRADFAAAAGDGLRLVLSGPGRFAVEARATIKDEVSRLSMIGTLAIVAVLLAVYRSPRLVGLGLLPVASGALAGVVAVSLAFGTVFGITVGFGVALIGEAVDYSIYYFVQSGRLGVDAWRERFWPTIRLGVATSLCGFGALMLSGFPGLAQLGLYALSGVLTAALVTRWLLPQLAGDAAATRDPGPAGRRLRAAFAALRRLRWPLLALAVAAFAYLGQQRDRLWQPDLSVLSTVSAEAAAVDGALRADLGAPDARYLVVVAGADREAALQAAERAGQRLDRLVADGLIGGYDTPARFLPSRAAQAARLASLPAPDELRPRLRAALADLPLAADKLDPFVEAVDTARRQAPIERADLDGSALALAVDSLLLPRAGSWSVLLPLRPPAGGADVDPAAVRAALAGSDALFIDMKGEFDTLYADYLDEAVALSGAGLLAIVLLLAVTLRSPRRLAAVLLPLVVAVALVVAGLHLAGERLHLLHLVGLLLIVAVGSNYALFFDHLEQAGGADDETLVAMGLANLTTTIGFGTLGLSSVPVLHAVGVTVGPGAVLALLLSAVFVPRGTAR
ncbi:MMPL family transporter [Azonexus sp.]|uniref:MMPL family transporter n=1 Tax=Azonexus sp. TaxID=1872668 RepID=UPI0035AF2E02